MTLKHRDLKGNQAVYLWVTNIELMLTGVKQARQTGDGTIELTYTDGTVESYKGDNPPELADMTIFEATSFVQVHRENKQ